MKDLKNRLSKARGTLARLKRIWYSSNIMKRTKLRLFKTVAVPRHGRLTPTNRCVSQQMPQEDSQNKMARSRYH